MDKFLKKNPIQNIGLDSIANKDSITILNKINNERVIDLSDKLEIFKSILYGKINKFSPFKKRKDFIDKHLYLLWIEHLLNDTSKNNELEIYNNLHYNTEDFIHKSNEY
tara:strand:+ start:1969 stop:2295 length:327 start_codon:yes stop_codon:yes gene_type:complete